MKRGAKLWWKIYFWLMAILVVGALLLDARYSDGRDLLDILDYGTWLFSLVGVFGFAYSKVIMNKRLWQIWLPIVVIWDVSVPAIQHMHEPLEMEPWFLALAAAIAAMLVLPQYVALYFYGHRSDGLWSSGNTR